MPLTFALKRGIFIGKNTETLMSPLGTIQANVKGL